MADNNNDDAREEIEIPVTDEGVSNKDKDTDTDTDDTCAIKKKEEDNNDDDRSGDDDEEEAAMKRMLAIQEEQEHEQFQVDNGNEAVAVAGDNNGNGNANNNNNNNNQIPAIADNQELLDDEAAELGLGLGNIQSGGNRNRRSFFRVHYTSLSFLLAITHVLYVLRTRKQAYLALLYLTSSKLSYIITGNVAIAFIIGLFFQTVQTFLNGLRLMETETIIDHIRWNVTETCIALTMFRHEINVKIMGIFLILILGKCLHWAVELRESHLRMTEEVFYFLDEEEEDDDDDLLFHNGDDDDVNVNTEGNHSNNNNTNPNPEQLWWPWKAMNIFLPKTIQENLYKFYRGIPRIRTKHLKLFILLNILYVFDILALTYCVSHILEDGPSVFIMFIFESSILMASIMSTSALFMCHVFDSMLNVMQKIMGERYRDRQQHQDEEVVVESNQGERSDEGGDTTTPEEEEQQQQQQQQQSRNNGARRKTTLAYKLVQQMASAWRDQRVTVTFIIELMALAAKFLFHLILFVVVFTLYGLPINIIRDFYLAFRRLRERLLAFSSYRRLTSNMNARFESVTSEDELDSAGRTCIICRDAMEVHGINGDCKKLPICEHVFHKHCLREWLVQQQSCPTCRGDLLANEARARALKKEQEQEEQEKKKKDNDNVESSGVARDGAEEQEAIGGEKKEEETKAKKEHKNNDDDVTTKEKKKNRVPPHPCLYRVKATNSSIGGASGTTLYEIREKKGSNVRLAYRKVTKTLMEGTMVVCIDAGVFTCLTDQNDGGQEYETHIYLKTPGGWILNDDAEHMVELKRVRI